GNQGDIFYLHVQSMTPDFGVEFHVTDDKGNLVADGSQFNGQPNSISILKLPSTGVFTVQMQSANAKSGQYTISIDNPPDPQEPLLPLGELINANSGKDATQTYTFKTDKDGSTFLMFDSPIFKNGLSISIMNAADNQPIAMFRPDIS